MCIRDSLDGAEFRFKQLLQHLPDHAAARYMLGVIYVQKGSLVAGVKLLEDALQRCPWNRHWQSDLAKAYRLTGRSGDAEALNVSTATVDTAASGQPGDDMGQQSNSGPVAPDYLYFSEESACASSGPFSPTG